jgi:hypothetical protein
MLVCGKVAGKPWEVCKKGMNHHTEADSFTFIVIKSFLQVAEQTTGSWNPQQHAAEFAQDLLPLAQGNAFLLWWDGNQDFQESGDAMRGSKIVCRTVLMSQHWRTMPNGLWHRLGRSLTR